VGLTRFGGSEAGQQDEDFGPLPALTVTDGPLRRTDVREGMRERAVEGKMLMRLGPKTRGMKALRLGLIVTFWTFMVFGFVLTHNA
jgi:hypothetical protein